MSVWHNVMVEDPKEGKIYDVWSKGGKRFIDHCFINGAWMRKTLYGYEHSPITVTHFMKPPEQPNN